MLQGLVQTKCHVFSEFEDSEKSPKVAFLIDAAVMLSLEILGMTTYIYNRLSLRKATCVVENFGPELLFGS